MENEEGINKGKIFYIEINQEDKNFQNYFSLPKEINLNKNIIKEFKLKKESALAITNKKELIQWQSDDSKNLKENNYTFLQKSPSYIFSKIKFKSISINSTMCLALDSDSKVMTWGHNSNGLLGLGYDITSIESPIYIEELKGKNISQIALSENHAIALSHSGIAFSWGLGKYGELGQERTIYTPFPLQINFENLYSKVFCSNYVTCFLDFECHFSYFGVIIRNIEIDNLNLTIKNLLEDESMNDGKNLVNQIYIEEIEYEKIIKVVIGNGFVGLLCGSGNLYVLEYKDKLTKLYSKYFCYDIEIYNNTIYGFAKNKNININYYLCQWSVKYKKGNLLSGASWDSTFWEIKCESNIISNFKFINIGPLNEIINMIFILDINKSNNNNFSEKKLSFEFDVKYDDSYNLIFKRGKSKNSTMIKDISSNSNNKSKPPSYKYLNRSYNNNSLRLNYNYSLYKPLNNIGLNKFKNKNYAKNKDKIINEYDLNKDIINKNNDKENIDINLNENLFEYKEEEELNNYRKEIDDIINNYIKNKKFKNSILSEDDKNNDKINPKNDDIIPLMQNQKKFSKTILSNSDINNKYTFNMKNQNSKDYPNNNNSNNNIKNIKNNNSNQNQNKKEVYSNIDEFFGKESSNIIKNDDVFSDLNEFSNTNFNYLCNNIDVSNKIYNCNNSNNLLINSDRTLNLSGNNYIHHRNNKRNLSPRFVNENESINFNSIMSAKIDKSNDFFSDYGKKQSRNNENNIIKRELNKNSKGSRLYRTKNLNFDIQESIIESNKSSDNYFSGKKYKKDKNVKNENVIRDIVKIFFLDDSEEDNIVVNCLTDYYDSNIGYPKYIRNNENNLNIFNSSPNLSKINHKKITSNKRKQNKIIKNKKRNEFKKLENFDNIENNNILISSPKNNNFIAKEDKKAGKFNFPNEAKEEKEINDSNKYCENKFKRSYISYFCFLMKLYMRKKLFKECIIEINHYKCLMERKYATKMIYRIMKRRIIFYEIKLWRRLKKIKKFYIKYEQRLNLINNKKLKYTKK